MSMERCGFFTKEIHAMELVKQAYPSKTRHCSPEKYLAEWKENIFHVAGWYKNRDWVKHRVKRIEYCFENAMRTYNSAFEHVIHVAQMGTPHYNLHIGNTPETPLQKHLVESIAKNINLNVNVITSDIKTKLISNFRNSMKSDNVFFLSDYNFDRRATFNSFGGDMRVDFTASYYIFVQKLIDAAFWGEKKQDCGLKNYCNNIPFLFSKIHIEAAVYLLYRLHPFAEFSHAVINILRATGIYNGHFSIESHYTWERGLKLYEPVSSTTYSQFHFDSLTPPKGLSIDDTITDYLKSIEIYYTGLNHLYFNAYIIEAKKILNDKSELDKNLTKLQQRTSLGDFTKSDIIDLKFEATSKLQKTSSKLNLNKKFIGLMICIWSWVINGEKPSDFEEKVDDFYIQDNIVNVILVHHLVILAKTCPIGDLILNNLRDIGFCHFTRKEEI